ncbi:MAG: alanine--glyoxylate aminotransferase family protein [Chloroflexi bacterium]|nr:alanine--glyoxylate aminotransferase family protein [Chloroflexota bacterium]
MNLRVPGPTPCPDPVLEAVGQQMINHRGPEFAQLIGRVTADLKAVFETENDLLILTSSGTGALEAAVVNTLSPGERCLVISVGVFGDRFAQIASAFGADVRRLDFPHGTAADPDAVRKCLRDGPAISTVFLTHNETSTGVTNDLEALSGVIKGEFDKTLVVDGVSSISSVPCPVDRWGIDLAVSGSQKGWMAPPGLAMVSVSPRGWKAVAAAKMPRVYFDLAAAKQALELGQTPWTPALSTLYGLQRGAALLLEEGMEAVYQRHAEIGAHTRQLVEGLGLELFADPRHASNTVTAIKVPPGVDWKVLSRTLRETHSVELAGGQGPLSGTIFRIGHLGWVNAGEIDQVASALEASLASLRALPSVPARSS